MSLPNPDYLTNELTNHDYNEITFPSVVVEDADTTTFEKKLLTWKSYDKFSHQILHDLIMGYAAVNGVTEANALPITATAPFYILFFDGNVTTSDLTSPAYQVDKERTATIVTDSAGTETVTIAATGGTPVTYNDVISAINTQTSATINHYDNSSNPWHQNFYIQGGTADSTGTINILDGNLFRDMIEFEGFRPFAGVDATGTGGTPNANGGLRGALELNLRSNRPYSEQFEYWILNADDQSVSPSKLLYDPANSVTGVDSNTSKVARGVRYLSIEGMDDGALTSVTVQVSVDKDADWHDYQDIDTTVPNSLLEFISPPNFVRVVREGTDDFVVYAQSDHDLVIEDQ